MASTNKSLISSSKKLLTAAASIAASAVLVRSIVNDLLPYEVRDYIFSGVYSLRDRLSPSLTIIIQDKDGFNPNKVYEAAKTYLATKIPPSTKRLSVTKLDEENNITLSVQQGEEIIDLFQGIQFRWQLVCQQMPVMGPDCFGEHNPPQEKRSFELSFHQKHKETAIKSYLPYILERAKAIDGEKKALKLNMNESDCWIPINLHHPATFATLAMEYDLKQKVMEDLARFVKRKDYYKKIGKAWKRGYLLYGPPGTGKSSLIAAMANYLKFDIYCLELTEVKNNSSLQRLMVGTATRSILVVEDIDCSVDLQNRDDVEGAGADSQDEKITLSVLLNFVDGLWSSCGEERIIVFTTNYKERLDPALLRPGRMDMHIHMGYCTLGGFKLLASNYHGVDDDHPMLGEIEELIKEVEITPAQVAEELLKSDDAEVALEEVINFLRLKKQNADEGQGREPPCPSTTEIASVNDPDSIGCSTPSNLSRSFPNRPFRGNTRITFRGGRGRGRVRWFGRR